MTWTRINLEYLHLTGAFTKLPSLIVIFSMFLYKYFVLHILGNMKENFIYNTCNKGSRA